MYHYRARVTRVVDGDTIDCDVDLGFHTWARIRLRLLGYNAPELRGPERGMGLRAQANLAAMLAGTMRAEDWIWVHTEKGDSFGRWLARVTLPTGADLVERLIRDGWGVPWDGRGKRPGFEVGVGYPRRRA